MIIMITYNISQRSDEPKYYYLYKQIKKDILTGAIASGDKLPSKRNLAEHLGISLITVENAYSMLKDEGYIETRERSGYYVSRINVQAKPHDVMKKLDFLPETDDIEVGSGIEENEPTKEFEPSDFPTSLYFKTVRSVISDYGERLLKKSPNEGCAILRNSIANYLMRYRGIIAQPKQIIIGSGAEHLYGCVSRMLGKEHIYGIEDPSYMQIQKVYEGTGAKVEKLMMGKEGIETAALDMTKADVLHVTPFHSYPSKVTATVAKRFEYLKWAENRNGYIVEDDFDSEFFMPGKPIETLYMMDADDRVIYINTFSNSLSPSIRMGYMILPMGLIDRYKKSSGGYSCTVPVLDQYVLAEFINKGYFEQHLSRIRRRRKMNKNTK